MESGMNDEWIRIVVGCTPGEAVCPVEKWI